MDAGDARYSNPDRRTRRCGGHSRVAHRGLSLAMGAVAQRAGISQVGDAGWSVSRSALDLFKREVRCRSPCAHSGFQQRIPGAGAENSLESDARSRSDRTLDGAEKQFGRPLDHWRAAQSEPQEYGAARRTLRGIDSGASRRIERPGLRWRPHSASGERLVREDKEQAIQRRSQARSSGRPGLTSAISQSPGRRLPRSVRRVEILRTRRNPRIDERFRNEFVSRRARGLQDRHPCWRGIPGAGCIRRNVSGNSG